MRILITGHSSGLGKSLSEVFTNAEAEVYGISRSFSNTVEGELKVDFSSQTDVQREVRKFTTKLPRLDCVFLNAGVLGDLSKATNIASDSTRKVMDINFYSHKLLIDELLLSDRRPRNVIAISSGAAISPKYGWFNYCLSKSCLKMLIETYAIEERDVKFLSLAPGLVKTKMQEIIKETSSSEIPSVAKFHEAYKNMDSPMTVAKKIHDLLPKILEKESGSYIDIRKMEY